MSQIIDPVSRNLTEDQDEIKDGLSKHFGNIGTDSTMDSDFKENIENIVKNRALETSTYENSPSVNFTRESIAMMYLSKLKSGNAPGIDDIPNEFLKYGGEIMIKTLSDMFKMFSDLETIPDDWHKGIIKPLHKSGSAYDLDNYRGITLSSNVYKLFSKTLERTIVDYLENVNVLGENQGAFRKDRRIEDSIFTLQGICSLTKSENKALYIGFFDFSKEHCAGYYKVRVCGFCKLGHSYLTLFNAIHSK